MILGEATLEVQVVARIVEVLAAVAVIVAGAGGQSPLIGENNS